VQAVQCEGEVEDELAAGEEEEEEEDPGYRA